ncbi:hypothetical protein F5Y16DRAFT_364138 [Xylariaceae sp. FL0255]|nr:hypothetical protein F5Y16DRAFT_364138 [Xylariaceae sp. FL0255]
MVFLLCINMTRTHFILRRSSQHSCNLSRHFVRPLLQQPITVATKFLPIASRPRQPCLLISRRNSSSTTNSRVRAQQVPKPNLSTPTTPISPIMSAQWPGYIPPPNAALFQQQMMQNFGFQMPPQDFKPGSSALNPPYLEAQSRNQIPLMPGHGPLRPGSTGNKTPKSSSKKEHRDRILPPSKGSGGVPNPTLQYTQLASHPPLILPNPRSILVVVDLNGTLLHRPNRKNPTNFTERPHAREFLSYCINTFTVVIWSSARPANVQNMYKQLVSDKDSTKVVAVWGRDKFGLSTNDYNMRVQCYKRLSTMWNDHFIQASHPNAARGEKWSQMNTVLVDDSLEKGRSEPYNLVDLPEFTGNAYEPGYILPQVHDYLNECSRQANISAYMRSSPFRVNPNFTL